MRSIEATIPPELTEFIKRVVVPALRDRLLREQQADIITTSSQTEGRYAHAAGAAS